MLDSIKVHVLDKGRSKLYMRYKDPLTGKDVTRSTGTTNPTEAMKAAAKWEAELQEGRYKSPLKVTWEEFRDRYESEAVRELADKTAERVSLVFNSIEDLIAPRRLMDMNASQIARWQGYLRDRGLSENTIKSYSGHLKAALRWAREVQLLHDVPSIRMPKRATTSKMMKGRAITSEEFERMLTKVPKVVGADYAEEWKHLLRGLWWSGLRLGEALKLTWDGDELRVEFVDGEPMLWISAEHQKSNKDELLVIAPEFVEMLLCVPEDQRTGPVFRTPTTRGETRRSDTVSKVIVRIGQAAGVKVSTERRKGEERSKFASAHDLRRAFGTRWASLLMPSDLKQLMRHEDIGTTMKFYVTHQAKGLASRLREARGDTLGDTQEKTASRDDAGAM